MKKIYIIIFTLLNLAANAQPEEKKEKKDSVKTSFHPSLAIGVITGVETGSSRVVFRSGKTFELRGEFKKNNKVFYGLSAGVDLLKDETFIPIGLTFRGKTRKKDNSPFLSAQLGYAFTSNAKTFSYINYSYHGGVFFSPGFGYFIKAGNHLNVLLSLDYKHQFAYIEYKGANDAVFKENLDYNFIAFRASFVF
jgi:hypothetical protein